MAAVTCDRFQGVFGARRGVMRPDDAVVLVPGVVWGVAFSNENPGHQVPFWATPALQQLTRAQVHQLVFDEDGGHDIEDVNDIANDLALAITDNPDLDRLLDSMGLTDPGRSAWVEVRLNRDELRAWADQAHPGLTA